MLTTAKWMLSGGNDRGQRSAAMLATRKDTPRLRPLPSAPGAPRASAFTSVQAFGADFALSVAGTRIEELFR